MRAADVRRALSKRWPDERYLLIEEAPLDSGRQGTKIDVLVLGLWRSDGLGLDAVEVKVSYSDWCKEWRRVEWFITDHLGERHRHWGKPRDGDLERFRPGTWRRAWRQPADTPPPPDGFEPTVERVEVVDVSKNAAWRAHATRFWVAAPEVLAGRIAADILGHEEMGGWGVLGVLDDGSVSVVLKPARRVGLKPLTHAQYLGIIRSAADSGLNALNRARSLGYSEGAADERRAERHRMERISRLMWEKVIAGEADRARADGG